MRGKVWRSVLGEMWGKYRGVGVFGNVGRSVGVCREMWGKV